jgi:hypothetical protein
VLYVNAAVCIACGSSEGARERPVPLRTVACDACWDDAVHFPDREPARPDVERVVEQLRAAQAPDPSQGTSASCKYCGASCSWHRTQNGRWLLLEPGGYPTEKVPPGSRWRVAGDGTAVNLHRANPADECRITHFDVCPSRPAPADGPLLLAIWRQRRQAIATGELGPPARPGHFALALSREVERGSGTFDLAPGGRQRFR